MTTQPRLAKKALCLAISTMFLSGVAMAETPCMKTANRMQTACSFDAKEGFFKAVSVCNNLAEGRLDCYNDAKDDQAEEMGLCLDQTDARGDLCELTGEFRYSYELDPDDIMSHDEVQANPNPFWPLITGMTREYEQYEDGEVVERILVNVTDRKRILTLGGDDEEEEGTEQPVEIELFIVNDKVWEVSDGEEVLIEDTDDYYVQTYDGTVVYVGELSLNFDSNGNLEDIDGSFLHGVEDAKAGSLMLGAPMVGDAYRQEWFLGEAEDWAMVLALDANPVVSSLSEGTLPWDCADACIATTEGTPLEPYVTETKYFAMGIGPVFERNDVSDEEVILVDWYIEN